MIDNDNFDVISSVDNVSFSVRKSYLSISKVIMASLEDDPTATTIELKLSRQVLEPIVMYMNECQGIDFIISPDMMRDKDIDDVISNPNIVTLIHFLGQKIKLLYQIINACNYLDISGFFNLGLYKIASLLRNESMRNIPGILSGSNLSLEQKEYITYSFEIQKKSLHIDILNDFKPDYIDSFLKDIFFYLAYPKFKICKQDGNVIDQLTDPGYLKYVLTEIISIYGEDSINWKGLSQNPALTPQIIRDFKDKWDWRLLSRNPALTPELIHEFKDNWDWKLLSLNSALTPQIILDFKDKWDWEWLSLNCSLTPEIIEEFKDNWDWNGLSLNSALTPEIIREFKNKWTWNVLSQNTSLTSQIIRDFEDNWDWEWLSLNRSLTPEIIEEFKRNWDWKLLSLNPILTPQIIRDFEDNWDWEELSRNRALTPEIIQEFKDNWEWKKLSRNRALTPQIIRDFKDNWDWRELSRNSVLTPETIQEFKDKWDWKQLSLNSSLTPKIIRDFKNKWDWNQLSFNPSLIPEIIREFKDNWYQQSTFYEYLQYLDVNIEGIHNDFIFYSMSSHGDIYKYLNDKIETINNKYRTDMYIHYVSEYLIPQLAVLVLNYM
jgi:hypothetical protein